jgi:hypothetical protein
MSWVYHRSSYHSFLGKHVPGVVLVSKIGLFWKSLAVLAAIFSSHTYQGFLERCVTSIGPFVGIPATYKSASASLLLHEARHVQQASWFGYLIPILGWIPGRVGFQIRALAGFPLYGLCYTLFPLPYKLAYFRFWCELDAERFAYRWMLRNGFSIKSIQLFSESFAKGLCSGVYGWPWPLSWGTKSFKKMVSKEVSILVSDIRI